MCLGVVIGEPQAPDEWFGEWRYIMQDEDWVSGHQVVSLHGFDGIAGLEDVKEGQLGGIFLTQWCPIAAQFVFSLARSRKQRLAVRLGVTPPMDFAMVRNNPGLIEDEPYQRELRAASHGKFITIDGDHRATFYAVLHEAYLTTAFLEHLHQQLPGLTHIQNVGVEEGPVGIHDSHPAARTTYSFQVGAQTIEHALQMRHALFDQSMLKHLACMVHVGDTLPEPPRSRIRVMIV